MLTELLARVRRLEDERDIARLIASYGPAVDAADAAAAAELWAETGTYDVENWQMVGQAEVQAMVSSSAHRELVAAGCSHFLGPAVVTVDGDGAIAVCESLVLLRRPEPLPDSKVAQEYLVWRAAANHFELTRGPDGWRITKRSSRMLDGGPRAHALLTRGLRGVPAGDGP
ncbi:nuclear transport factor 2 family protein [[Mycobacterium] wendilense]|uniref:Nuclear transport factor 2 family protein n=1 Tax=[Mycobacterium] wendilense TaxID=3064284 RepID=A0ABM9MKC6_9MYCO|nr:nuclear transport factor 2 family protein [Mycolicibacterium sp. MU0050]CAJ1587318.1 nuclear transport factor 2 family protein [Mycolicibacterium sp. MU0050]